MLGPIKDALFYHSLSLAVIPCEYGGKRSKVEWKEYQCRIPTIEELQDGFRERCNLAIVTGAVSGVVVVDADSEPAQRWVESSLPISPCRTRTFKGEHHYYKHPGIIIGNRAKLRGLRLDVRADG